MQLQGSHLEALRQLINASVRPATGWDGAIDLELVLSPAIWGALDLLIQDRVLGDSVQVGRNTRPWTAVARDITETVTVQLPILDWAEGSCVAYRSLDALIKRGRFMNAAPGAMFLIDENLIVPPDAPTGAVDNYLQAVALTSLLEGQADHLDRTGGRVKCVFLHKASLTLPIEYGEADLREPIEGLETLRELLASDEHREQKRSIFKAALYECLANTQEPSRFRHLLRSLPQFSKDFCERYQLFVSEYDFEKVREELEEKRRDCLSKLNGTFNDLSGKLLSIPVALYVALTTMKPLPATGSPFEAFAHNSVVLVAAFVVAGYVLLVKKSQRNTLDAITSEYSGLFRRWSNRLRFADQRREIDVTKDALDERKRRLINYFRITNASVYVTMLLTLSLYVLRLMRWEDKLVMVLRAVKDFLLR